MNYKTLIYFGFLVAALTGCAKYEHEAVPIPNCELCAYAETLEGSYRGLASGDAAPNLSDSITISVQQVFLGNSQYEDSTYIQLEISYDFDSSLETFVDTVRLIDSNGKCFSPMGFLFGPPPSYNFSGPAGEYQFGTDSLVIDFYYHHFTTGIGSGGGTGADILYLGGIFHYQ